MKPHFASTIHAVRQMVPCVTTPAVVPGSSSPTTTLPKPTTRKLERSMKRGDRRVMVLPDGESLTIVDSGGRALLEIASGENGPELRLAHDDLRVECPGHLNLAAKAITMEAIEDVTVRGRTIRLN